MVWCLSDDYNHIRKVYLYFSFYIYLYVKCHFINAVYMLKNKVGFGEGSWHLINVRNSATRLPIPNQDILFVYLRLCWGYFLLLNLYYFILNIPFFDLWQQRSRQNTNVIYVDCLNISTCDRKYIIYLYLELGGDLSCFWRECKYSLIWPNMYMTVHYVYSEISNSLSSFSSVSFIRIQGSPPSGHHFKLFGFLIP